MKPFEIQKDIEMPAKKITMADIFNNMEVGDSFYADDVVKKAALQARVSHFNTAEKRFTGQTVEENGKKVYRVWRIK